MPSIAGRLFIYNEGICKLGRNIRFNSDLSSNLIGLYKPCTIYVSKHAELSIDDYSGFSGVSIYCANNIKIGKHVKCGGNVGIWDTDFHPLDFEKRRFTLIDTKSRPIIIGDDVFIGANSMILKGVNIGDRAIVGAGSVVTKGIPPDEVWAGNPAKCIRKK